MQMKPGRRSVAGMVLPLLCACAQTETKPAPAEPFQRVVLYTAIEWPGLAEVTNRTARLAGVPVRDVVETGPRRYRLSLLCADTEACRSAIARVAADRTFALAVDAEGRVQIPAKPTREAAR